MQLEVSSSIRARTGHLKSRSELQWISNTKITQCWTDSPDTNTTENQVAEFAKLVYVVCLAVSDSFPSPLLPCALRMCFLAADLYCSCRWDAPLFLNRRDRDCCRPALRIEPMAKNTCKSGAAPAANGRRAARPTSSAQAPTTALLSQEGQLSWMAPFRHVKQIITMCVHRKLNQRPF